MGGGFLCITARAKQSTLTKLLAHWDNILEGLKNNPGVDSVYLDFAKVYKLKEAKVLGKVGY